MAVSEDDGPDSQAQEKIHDQAGGPLTPSPTRTRTTKRQALRDQERRLLDQGSRAVDRARASTAGTFWSRLNAVAFMNSSLQFAALAVLCLFPFMIIVAAESGVDVRGVLIARLGLDQNAARDVDQLVSSGSHAVTTLSIVGAAVVLLGALGIASNLQVWYERAYDQPPAQNSARQLANRLLWLGGAMGYLTLQDFSFIHLNQVGGAGVLIYVATFILAVPFYWWTPHVLLLGRVAWGRLFPVGLATAACVAVAGSWLRAHGLIPAGGDARWVTTLGPWPPGTARPACRRARPSIRTVVSAARPVRRRRCRTLSPSAQQRG